MTSGSGQTRRASAAVVGSGNIGTDLVHKLLKSSVLRPDYLVGIDPASDGLRRAAGLGVETSAAGIEWLLERPALPDVVFEATSAQVHLAHAPRYLEAGVPVVDLTPAAVGPQVVPVVNLDEHLRAPNLNMITCGGQATIPIIRAVTKITRVEYAEIVATIASCSAGPGTRANIDEFTWTTARGIETIGGAAAGKAIIILNPAQPPVLMRDTVYCSLLAGADRAAITASIVETVDQVRRYVPGYRLKSEPQFDADRVVVFLEVEGAGDYLPPYAGNLDIMTAAALRVGEELVRAREVIGA